MRNKTRVLVMAILCWQTSFSQINIKDDASTTKYPNFTIDYLKTETSTSLYVPKYDRIDGSPYLSPEWAYARIKLADSRLFDSVLLKLDLYENRVLFKDANGNVKMIPVSVRMIEIRDVSSKWNNVVFVSGYGKDDREFYQVVADGKKAGLIKKMKVIIKETRDINGIERRNFELQNVLCIYSKDTLYEEKKNCIAMVDPFRNDEKLAAFIAANDIKCNKEKEMAKLVDFYNSY
jgi:hypothetical protein